MVLKVIFKGQQQTVPESAESVAFKALQVAAKNEQMVYDTKYPEVPCQKFDSFHCNMIDEPSTTLWASDADSSLVPLQVFPDGNCLFRSVSVLCCNKESPHIELRARALCELVSHSDFYLSFEKCSALDYEGVLIKNILPACSANSFKASQKEFVKEVFYLDCLDTARCGTFANMWHIYALASVLEKPIVSMYPDFNARIRPAFNRTVHPRNIKDDQHMHKFVIMWTSTCVPSSATCWTPNHFVPCIPKSTCNMHREDTFTTVSRYARRKKRSYSAVAAANPVQCKLKSPKQTCSTKPKVQTSLKFQLLHSLTPKLETQSQVDATLTLATSHKSLSNSTPLSRQHMEPMESWPSLDDLCHDHYQTSQSHDNLSLQSSAADPPQRSEPSQPEDCWPSLDATDPPRDTMENWSSHYPSPTSSESLGSWPAIPESVDLNLHLSSSSSESDLEPWNPTDDTIDTSMPEPFDYVHSWLSKCQPHATDHRMSIHPVLSPASFSSSEPSESDYESCPALDECNWTELYSPSSPTPFPDCTPKLPNSSSASHIATTKIPKFESHGNVRPSKKMQFLLSSSTSNLTCTSSKACSSFPPMPYSTQQLHAFTCSSPTFKIVKQPTTVLPSVKLQLLIAKSTTLSRSGNAHNNVSESALKHNSVMTTSTMNTVTPIVSHVKSNTSTCTSKNSLPVNVQVDSLYTTTPTLSPKQGIPAFPFPLLSLSWYRHRGQLAAINDSRNADREANKPITIDGEVVSLKRAKVKGSIAENIAVLQRRVQKAKGTKIHKELQAMVDVGEYLQHGGPLLPTQEVIQHYSKIKDKSTKIIPATFDEMICKYFNVAQVYIYGKAYIMQNTECDPRIVLQKIKGCIEANKQQLINQHVQDKIGDIYKKVIEYVDTDRDRKVVKALLAEITSCKFSSMLQGIQNTQSIQNARLSLRPQLSHFEELKTTSQVVRTGMTNEQQRRLTKRIVQSRKIKEIRTINAGRGRHMKTQQFPELASVIEYAFGERDIQELGGGGVESHPRLTDGVLYRSHDNKTTMAKAREVILALSPPDFEISLSCCYNYTENYRAASYQAKRHHFGKDVNAQVSLHSAPRIGVPKFVINLHWTTANVCYLADYAHQNTNKCMIVSKDAKAVIPANIPPVQQQGKTWRKIILPDHTWDQSRCDAITPMTFLFLETIENPISDQTCASPMIAITRTGTPVTLLNLSWYEPETVFKCLNELFILVTNPALDSLFRDPDTGNLKQEFIFIVDNGPSEAPSNSMVRMCLVRLLQFLKLHKVVQVSFAEYHSKRNYVERVHAVENEALSKHGPFSSATVHKNARTGSNEHKQNMEAMATKVAECLSQGKFRGHYLQAYRGVSHGNYVFDDEATLKEFLALSEDRKEGSIKHTIPLKIMYFKT